MMNESATLDRQPEYRAKAASTETPTEKRVRHLLGQAQAHNDIAQHLRGEARALEQESGMATERSE